MNPTTGRIKFFNFEKGYGFIRREGKDLFVHADQLTSSYIPVSGDLVEFQISDTRRGPAAMNVVLISRSDRYVASFKKNLSKDLKATRRGEIPNE